MQDEKLENIFMIKHKSYCYNGSIHTVPCQRAETKEECETLAVQLGFNDIGAGVTNDLERPPYCYYKPVDAKLWFNTAMTGNTTPCTNNRNCVCKSGIYHA